MSSRWTTVVAQRSHQPRSGHRRDQAEVAGGTFAGLDLYARGVRTGQRDLLVEIDYMPHADPAVTPRQAAVDRLVAAFAPRGIAVHADLGALFSATPGAGYNFGGGGQVPFVPMIGLGTGSTGIYTIKLQNMDVRRHAVSHYLVFGYQLDVGALGIAELGGNDVIVALGNVGFNLSSPEQILTTENMQAITMMHELGHNLGLLHGGGDSQNFKPNYVSVMNYFYSSWGVPTIGNVAEGDRYYLMRYPLCTLIDHEWDLHNHRATATHKLDFSDGTGAPLNEAALVEAAGLGRPGSAAVDYDCDGALGTAVVDVDNDGAADDIHTDYDDWGNLQFAFSRTLFGGSTFVPYWRPSQFTDEQRPAADETGFQLPRPR